MYSKFNLRKNGNILMKSLIVIYINTFLKEETIPASHFDKGYLHNKNKKVSLISDALFH